MKKISALSIVKVVENPYTNILVVVENIDSVRLEIITELVQVSVDGPITTRANADSILFINKAEIKFVLPSQIGKLGKNFEADVILIEGKKKDFSANKLKEIEKKFSKDQRILATLKKKHPKSFNAAWGKKILFSEK